MNGLNLWRTRNDYFKKVRFHPREVRQEVPFITCHLDFELLNRIRKTHFKPFYVASWHSRLIFDWIALIGVLEYH
jgi:hypothetical protein